MDPSYWICHSLLPSSAVTHACMGEFRQAGELDALIGRGNMLELLAAAHGRRLRSVCKQQLQSKIADVRTLQRGSGGSSGGSDGSGGDFATGATTSQVNTTYAPKYACVLLQWRAVRCLMHGQERLCTVSDQWLCDLQLVQTTQDCAGFPAAATLAYRLEAWAQSYAAHICPLGRLLSRCAPTGWCSCQALATCQY